MLRVVVNVGGILERNGCVCVFDVLGLEIFVVFVL